MQNHQCLTLALIFKADSGKIREKLAQFIPNFRLGLRLVFTEKIR